MSKAKKKAAPKKRADYYKPEPKVRSARPGVTGVSVERKTVGTPIDNILNTKEIKIKEKVSAISKLLLSGKVSVTDLISAAKTKDDINKATIMESMEYASKTKADIISDQAFKFAIESLKSDAPRIKWESARVIANTAHLFPKLLKKAVGNLLENTEHSGTVVRWSAAGALTNIIQCNTELNKGLIPAIKAIEKREDDGAIKKIYQRALKKTAK